MCGSAHCQIAEFWSKELGKSEIHAYQASKNVIIKNLTDNDIKKLIDSADRALKKYYLMR